MTVREEPGERVAARLWRFCDVEFDESKWELRVHGEMLTIERRPLEILLYLLRHAGDAVTKDELIEAVWGHAYVSDGALTNAIVKLRRALDDDTQAIIGTVHRIGYRLLPPVQHQTCATRVPLPSLLKPGDPMPGRPDWLLLRMIGGGIDTEVWLGEHTTTDEQRAFKLSPEGTRLPALKREAALLRLIDEALGSRPDIIQLRDWNFDILPFFIACQYGGMAMQEWADTVGGLNQLPLDLRLELMARIADAVAAAHSIGVLHKDLKPANVLIEGDASACTLRLTDFGSGQLTDPMQLAGLGLSHIGLTQARTLTTDDQTGTHLYVAPELMTGNLPTVQSDIFSLGVMVYQIAVGDFRRPLAPGWEREIGDELLRLDIADAANGNPEHRIASARTLSERLRGLASRRIELADRRTAEQVAQANAVALLRARSRRRWLLTLVGTLSVGLLVSLYNYRVAVRARDEARRQEEIATAINDFMDHDLIGSANPFNTGGEKDITVQNAARNAAKTADERLTDRPQIASALHRALGNLFSQMSDSEDAETEYRKAIEAYKSVPDPNPLEQATNELLLGSTEARISHFDKSRQNIADAEVILANLSNVPTAVRQQLIVSKAALQTYLMNYTDATTILEAGIVLGSAPDADKRLMRTLLNNLATCYSNTGRYQDADDIYRQLIPELTEVEGWDAPRTLFARVMSAHNQMFLGQTTAVETELIELDRQLTNKMGANHRWTLWSESYLGEVEGRQGRWQQARDTFQTLYEKYRRQNIEHTVSGIAILVSVGQAEYELGQDNEAIRELRLALDDFRSLSQADSAVSHATNYYLALALLDVHRAPEAFTLLEPLKVADLNAADPYPDWEGRLALARGRAAAQTGRLPLARQEFQTAVASFSRHQPDDAALLDKARREQAALASN